MWHVMRFYPSQKLSVFFHLLHPTHYRDCCLSVGASAFVPFEAQRLAAGEKAAAYHRINIIYIIMYIYLSFTDRQVDIMHENSHWPSLTLQ